MAGSGPLMLDYGSPTPGDLENAWADTIEVARKKGGCPAGGDLDICIRRKRS